MKRIVSTLLVMAFFLLSAATAFAVEATDVPGTPTQDEVLSLEAKWLNESNDSYELLVMSADKLTMDTVTEIYRFVYEEKNRPVRYFPEETQKQIEEMLDGAVDPDSLYMTEFMRLHAAEAQPETDLEAEMLLDVDYQPGQLTVVVLGDTTDPENLVWTAVESEVTELGKVVFTIPQELMEQVQGEDVLFSLLTVRKGDRGGIVNIEKETKLVELPSKTAYDTMDIIKYVSEGETPIPETFELLITEESETILKEFAMIRNYVKEQKQPICTWLPEESQNEIQLLLDEGFEMKDLVVYDYLPLITRNYKDTYGDVISSFTFATPYTEGQQVVTVLGLPKQGAVAEGESLMEWAVQRAQVNGNGEVEIVFDQLALIGMGEETGFLLVLSEPIAE